MLLHVASLLPCPPDLVWNEVQHISRLREIAWPLVSFHDAPGEKLPESWTEGQLVRFRSFLFGLIPLGTRKLKFERIDRSAGEMLTRESDQLCSRWDHCIRVRPLPDGQTKYSDTVEIDAGWLTPFVWLFARWFYRHRQRRWQEIAQRLSPPAPPGKNA